MRYEWCSYCTREIDSGPCMYDAAITATTRSTNHYHHGGCVRTFVSLRCGLYNSRSLVLTGALSKSSVHPVSSWIGFGLFCWPNTSPSSLPGTRYQVQPKFSFRGLQHVWSAMYLLCLAVCDHRGMLCPSRTKDEHGRYA